MELRSRTDRIMRTLMIASFGLMVLMLGSGCTEAEFARIAGLAPDEPVVKEPWPLDLANPPQAYNESYTTFRDEPLKIRAESGVLSNDQFAQWLYDFTGITEEGGFVDLEADGSFVYSPPSGFMGADHFRYTIENDRGSASATVTIKIVPFDSVPVPAF